MTLADRIEAVIRRLGPLPLCVIATEVEKRKIDVLRVLEHDARFVHNGRKGPASRWDVVADGELLRIDHAAKKPLVGVDAADLAARWEALLELSTYTAASFVDDFVERGVLERIDGNGRVRATEHGRELMAALMTGGGE